MPAILTHDFFGRDALGIVGNTLEVASPDTHDAFLLGNQGPDPLFYLVADPTVDASMRVGGLMHHERPARLLCSLREAVALLPADDRAVGRAYATGFLCHYLLDSSVHPLVFAQQYAICDAGVEGLDRSDGSVVHAEIERDLDETVLFSKRGDTVRDYRPYRETLRASGHVLDVVDKLYFYMCLWTYGQALDANVYSSAVRAFRMVQRLFWTCSDVRREALGAAERLVTGGRYSLYCAMSHRVRAERTSAFDNHECLLWTNPFTGSRLRESFWDLYEGALAQVGAAQAAFLDAGFDWDAARRLTRGINFSGEPVDELAPVGSVDGD